jgi:hypothetical protein
VEVQFAANGATSGKLFIRIAYTYGERGYGV